MRLFFVFCVVSLFCGNALAQPNTVAVEALSRLKGMDLEANPALKTAVLKVLETTRGTPQFVEIVRDFKLTGHADELLKFAAGNSTNSLGIEALRIATAETGLTNLPLSPGLVEAMGNSADKQFVPALIAALADADLRKPAVKALAQTEAGSAELLKLAREDKLDGSIKLTAAGLLNTAHWPAIKAEAAEVLPLPKSQNAVLPPVSELIKLKGDPIAGAKVYRRQEVSCIQCHRVNGEGIDFGPDLSEIGSKLALEAIYDAILDPSAGISHGYEAWDLELKNGDELFGIITSETSEEVVLKTQTGISTHYKKSDIAKRRQSKVSIMPQGLQLGISQQELVDLVEYLSSLKKKN